MSELPSEHLPEELLLEYLDGELSLEEQSQVEHHIKHCAGCASRLESWSGLFTEIEQLPEIGQVIDFEPIVLAQLNTKGSSRQWLTWILAGQVVLTMTLLGYSWQRLSAYIPLERVSRWLSLPLQTIQTMISGFASSLAESFHQYLVWSFSHADLIVRVPRLTDSGTLLVYLVLLAVGLWAVSNHYLLRTNRQSEDIRP